MKIEEVRKLVNQCKFEGFEFLVSPAGSGFELHAAWLEPDISGGKAALQKSRKWLLSQHMTKSEVVQTCFKLAITVVEHRGREAFTYRGNRIFGPHFDVDALHEICRDRRFDVRALPQ